MYDVCKKQYEGEIHEEGGGEGKEEKPLEVKIYFVCWDNWHVDS